MRRIERLFSWLMLSSSLCAFALQAHAQDAMGAPPPEASGLVEAPKDVAVEPKIEKKDHGTAITLSAGGQYSGGNSRLVAGTANGAFDKRWGENGLGATLLGNYGKTAVPGTPGWRTTAENIQGRARYDRYVLDDASVFLLNTLRHDRFQGIDLRYNVDPGFKYLALKDAATSLGLEAGYDFQYDVRRRSASTDATPPLSRTATDHSLRAYVGFKHAFNAEVTLSTGLEYLQSVVHSVHYRLNYDALFAAKVVGGLALGVGYTMRFDRSPLPGKKKVDNAITLSIIYSYSDEAPPAPAAAAPAAPAPALPAPAPAPPIPPEPAAPADAAPAPADAAATAPNSTGVEAPAAPPATPAPAP
jgi:uncharacterized protein DUF481